ncbi:MAG TPA: hypothetical protein VHD81_09220 [Mycobacteriales bacterium]|nr:hypothetical protein [Mycobacteriales bacterium]
MLWTVLLLVPVALLTYLGIVYPGRPRAVVGLALVVWTAFMAFLLRDIWKAVSIPVRIPDPE